jgi:integrative and conjugative element protein (TIGR02256 family)
MDSQSVATTPGVWMLYHPIIWISEDSLDACIVEAKKHSPLETGGVFMGYWADATAAVVTSIIGAGPAADRGHRHFAPDYEWQIDEIARHYEASGRRHSYLGDWHSHPGQAYGTLSKKDRRVLRRIIQTPAARASKPVMAIIHGSETTTVTIWIAELRGRPFLWPELNISQVELRAF